MNKINLSLREWVKNFIVFVDRTLSNATFMIELVQFRIIYYQHETLIRIRVINLKKQALSKLFNNFFRFGSYFYIIIFLLADNSHKVIQFYNNGVV